MGNSPFRNRAGNRDHGQIHAQRLPLVAEPLAYFKESVALRQKQAIGASRVGASDILIEAGNRIDSNFHLNDGFELANQTGRTGQDASFGTLHTAFQPEAAGEKGTHTLSKI